MTAQIVSLVEHRNRRADRGAPATPAPSGTAALAQFPAPVAPPDATIVTATAALSSACRDMAVNLAAMMAHAEAAFTYIGHIGETADALAKTGADLKATADSFKDDYLRTAALLEALDASDAPQA